MPIAVKHDPIPEDEQNLTLPVNIPEIDTNLLDEITEMKDKIRKLKLEDEENKRKIAKLESGIEAAESMLQRAQSKREVLAKRRTNLIQSLNSIEQRKKEALEYWNNFYGLDVKQMSKEGDNFEQYEFIFTKLLARAAGDKRTDSDGGRCSMIVRLSEKSFEIMGQEPELLTANKLTELSSRLTNECIHPETGQADYRLATKLIKKELLMVLDP